MLLAGRFPMRRRLFRIRVRRWALFLALALLGSQAQAFEDCFNDDDTLAQSGNHNDLEPPLTPMPALTVSDEDFARVLAAIAEHEQRIGAQHPMSDDARSSSVTP